MSNPILAWHFLKADCKLKYAPYTEVKPGAELEVNLPLKTCDNGPHTNGLHASRRIIDALTYAPGPVVCRVELSGEMIEGKDKICAQRRKVLWMYDATTVLHEFACAIAEQALLHEHEAGREPDPRSWKAIKVKREWLKGEATSEELEAAREAARGARTAAWAATQVVCAAAKKAACVAAWKAVWAAVRAAEAARETACVAAAEAAWVAASAPGREAAWAEQNALLEKMILEGRP